MGRPYFFTSVIANYLPKARVLAKTLRRHLPDASFHVAFPDVLPEDFNLAAEPFDSILTPNELGIPNFDQWVFTHTIVEASTAVKGPALRRLLEQPDCDCVIYFDPDIAVLHPVDRLLETLKTSSVILTPHLTEPERTMEGILENELSVLQHGIYNLGFVGVANSSEGREFAAWWEDRLLRLCFDDIPRGLFTDQRWCDLAPAYFDRCQILREAAYNVCTWNLSHRTVTGSMSDGILVNGEPIVFYHFSGLDSGAQEKMLSRHGSAMPALWELRDWYLAECEANGQATLGTRPWRYSHFDNGVAINKKQRRLYRDRGDLREAFPEPFRTDPPHRSFFHWYAVEGQREELGRESQPEGLPSHLPGPELPPAWRRAEPYQVVIWVPGELTDAQAAAMSESLANIHCSQWIAAGSPSSLASVEQRSFPKQPEATVDASTMVDACRAVSDRWPGLHCVMLSAGVRAPLWWDLRLIWPLSGMPEAASVTPMVEREAIGLTAQSESVAAAADYNAWFESRFEAVDGRPPTGECFALSRTAAALLKDFRGTLDTYLERLTKQYRFRCFSIDDLVVRSSSASESQPRPESNPAAGRPHSNRSLSQVDLRPRLLHVMHSWGGGLERWVREFAAQDVERRHLMLRSKGTWGAFGQFLELSEADGTVLETAQLRPWIPATSIEHPGYRQVLANWLARYGISAVYVSSWIGHSLDLLDVFRGCLVVCHDYYPYCPALNITFEKQCSACQEGRLTQCTADNPHHRFFRNVPPPYWIALRQEYAARIAASGATLVAPSPSVQRNLTELEPGLAGRFEIVAHGVRRCGESALAIEFRDGEPLRILVPGSMAPNKGSELIAAIRPHLRHRAKFAFIGGGEATAQFADENTIVVPSYDWQDLPGLVKNFGPHLALLPSVVPETFSFTLQEMFDLGIPVLASNIGSFEDRIVDGVNGFLAAPEATAFLAKIQSLLVSRSALKSVAQQLRLQKRRTPAAMVQDYQRLRPQISPSPQAYYARDWQLREGKEVPQLTLQCYWRDQHSSYSEADSAIQSVPFLAGTYRLQWDLRQKQEISELRIDWADQPTFLVLQRLLLRAGGALHDLAGLGCLDIIRRGFHCSDTKVLAGDSQNGLVLGFLSHDPQMIVPLPAGVEQCDSLEMTFRLPARDEIRKLIDARSQAGELPDGDRGILEKLWSTYVSEPGSGRVCGDPNLEQELLATRLRVRELEGSLSWRITKPLRDLGRIVLQARSAKV